MRQFLGHPGFQKYFANTSWLIGERVLRMVISLFVGIYVARYLGPERFGLLSYTLSFVLLFGSLASFGLDDILVRELLQSPEKRNYLIGTVFWLKVCGTVLMGITIFTVLQFLLVDQHLYWMIALISFGFLFQATNVVDFYFQSQVQSKFVVRAQVIQLFVTSIFKIYLIWNQAELIWFAFALMLDQAVVAVLFLVLYRWKISWFPFFSFCWNQAKKLMKDAWPLIFAGMVVSVYMKIDQVMLKEMLDAKAVGIYAAAVKICEAWYFLPTAVIASLFPAVIEARIKSETLFDERVQNLYDLMVWSSVAVALPTTLLADWVILILFGTDFQEAADVLRIYIWASVFVTLGIASSKWLVAENLQRYLFFRTALGALINVGCNLWLIPIYGIKGAAFSTLIAQGVVGFLSLSFFKKTRNNFLLAVNSLSIYSAYKRTFQKIIIRGR